MSCFLRSRAVWWVIFQEINDEFTDMESCSLDELEKKVLSAMYKLAGYIQRNREGIWYKEAKEKDISIGSGSADKAGDILICRRFKLRGMRWSRTKADNVLNICILVFNGEWDTFWSQYKAA